MAKEHKPSKKKRLRVVIEITGPWEMARTEASGGTTIVVDCTAIKVSRKAV